ncbi:hypothetical protein AB0I81_46510 [Nonomuraea sp. NPDC050404]|uniref:hypothetical protein n=1 Tax=Nonomuraea sp. NPDC050404 TaxID=3155783 RepID=UPI0033C9EB70
MAVGVYFLVDGMAGMTGVAPTRTFASGESVTVRIDPADRPGVFITGDTAVTYDCSISGGPGQARLARTTDAQTITAGGAEWEQFLVINAPAKGEYQLTCSNQGQATVRYGVGGDLSAAVGRAAGGMFTLIFVPAGGLLVAIGGTVTVLLLRKRSRRRLAVGG